MKLKHFIFEDEDKQKQLAQMKQVAYNIVFKDSKSKVTDPSEQWQRVISKANQKTAGSKTKKETKILIGKAKGQVQKIRNFAKENNLEDNDEQYKELDLDFTKLSVDDIEEIKNILDQDDLDYLTKQCKTEEDVKNFFNNLSDEKKDKIKNELKKDDTIKADETDWEEPKQEPKEIKDYLHQKQEQDFEKFAQENNINFDENGNIDLSDEENVNRFLSTRTTNPEFFDKYASETDKSFQSETEKEYNALKDQEQELKNKRAEDGKDVYEKQKSLGTKMVDFFANLTDLLTSLMTGDVNHTFKKMNDAHTKAKTSARELIKNSPFNSALKDLKSSTENAIKNLEQSYKEQEKLIEQKCASPCETNAFKTKEFELKTKHEEELKKFKESDIAKKNEESVNKYTENTTAITQMKVNTEKYFENDEGYKNADDKKKYIEDKIKEKEQENESLQKDLDEYNKGLEEINSNYQNARKDLENDPSVLEELKHAKDKIKYEKESLSLKLKRAKLEIENDYKTKEMLFNSHMKEMSKKLEKRLISKIYAEDSKMDDIGNELQTDFMDFMTKNGFPFESSKKSSKKSKDKSKETDNGDEEPKEQDPITVTDRKTDEKLKDLNIGEKPISELSDEEWNEHKNDIDVLKALSKDQKDTIEVEDKKNDNDEKEKSISKWSLGYAWEKLNSLGISIRALDGYKTDMSEEDKKKLIQQYLIKNKGSLGNDELTENYKMQMKRFKKRVNENRERQYMSYLKEFAKMLNDDYLEM